MEKDNVNGSASGTHNFKSDSELLQKNPENKEMVEYQMIEDTPFTAVRFNQKWYLCFGKYRLTNAIDTKEKCIEEAKDTSWERLMAIIKAMLIDHDEEKQLQRTIEQQQQSKTPLYDNITKQNFDQA